MAKYVKSINGVNASSTASGDSGVEITNATIQGYLEDNANWENPSRPFSDPTTADYYYPFYTGTAITGQSEHDYYIGIDTFTLSICKYELLNISGTLTATRTHIQQK